MMVDNDYTKLGTKLKVFAILTLVVALLNLVETYLFPLGISGLVAIPLLVFQILMIVGAKKCANTYNKRELNTFATLMIVALVLSFASIGVIFAMSFAEALNVVRGGGTTVNVLPILVAGEVISLITIAIETIAWFFMLDFFSHLEEVDARARGKPGAILVIVGCFVAVVSSVAIGIPSILMNPTFDIENVVLVMSAAQEVASGLLSIGNSVLSVVGYFILSAVFAQLGNLKGSSAAYPSATTAASWAGRDPYGSPPPGAWNGAPPAEREFGAPGTTDPNKCPFCGASLLIGDPRALFCGECGAKLPGRG